MTTTRERAAVDRSIDLPGAERALAERVAERLEAVGARGAEPAALADRAGAGAGPDDVAAALARLAAEGRAVERQGRWYAVGSTEWVAGRVDRLDGGDALVRPVAPDGPRRGRPGDPAFLVDSRHLKGALDGDTVLVKRLKGRPREAAGRRLPPAAVVDVLARRSQRLVGILESDEDGRRWLVPYEARSNLECEVVEAERVPDDHYVVVDVIRGSGTRGGHPRATVVEDLGHAEAPGTDLAVVLRHYRIPDEFPPEVEAAAAGFPPDPRPEDFARREDLRERLTVTIDGESARDFDDAVTCERLGDGRWRVGVHIADVSHYVEEGGALDREAYRRGTSAYYPERAVPMLPEALSNGLCSLRPAVPRLTQSAFLDVDREGRVLRRRFAETVIRSDRRLTYAEVRRLLEEERPGDPREYGDVLPMLRECREVMTALRAARSARGSIDFDLPEGDVVLDTDGVTVGVTPGERNVAHRIVEEMMIAANEAVALELEGAAVASLYRVHDAPSPEDLEGLREVLGSLGFRLPTDLERLHPRHLQAVLAAAEGTPQEPFVSTVVLRTMQRAVYSPDNRGHYGLASRHYTHFTSPIRRYPDLVVHRRLRAHLRGEAAAEEGGRRRPVVSLAERLPGIAEHASAMERRAEQSERDLLQWKKVRFLASRVGETFSGRITGVQPFGLFVQLDEYYVDGLVPIRTLGDDFYLYEAEEHRLVGENRGRVFRLADAVEVRLAGVSLRHRGLDLEIAGLAEPARRPRGRRR
jgi:ribonuclease R